MWKVSIPRLAKKDATWPSARVVATDNFRRVSESYYGISPVDGFSPGAYLGGKPSKNNPSRDCEAVPQSELEQRPAIGKRSPPISFRALCSIPPRVRLGGKCQKNSLSA